jgi:hypothetical protein
MPQSDQDVLRDTFQQWKSETEVSDRFKQVPGQASAPDADNVEHRR